MAKKKNLGKGLEALISQYSTEEKESHSKESILLSDIEPNINQPRKEFDEDKMNELILSVKSKGILQPIAVHELKNGKYEIIAGERRYRAAKEAGIDRIPVHILSIKDKSEIMEFSLIENIQRVDLDPIEESEAFSILKSKYNLSQNEIAKRVSKSRSQIANSIRLLNLPISIKNDLKSKKISVGHARALLGLKNKAQMLAAAERIKNKCLNVRDTENLVSKITNFSLSKSIKQKNNSFKNINSFESKLIKKYGTKVLIQFSNLKKGRIIFEYYSKEDLERLLELLNN